MTKRKEIHIVPAADEGWKVKKGGAEKASKCFDKKTEAQDYAKQQGKKEGAEVVDHRKDGTIRKSTSYGADPCPPKDKK